MGRAVATLAALLLLAGCGGSSKSPRASEPAERLVTAAERAALQATVVHVVGVTSDDGVPLKLDLWLGAEKSKGRLVEAGTPFDVVRVADTVYVRGGGAFLRHLLGSVPRSGPGTWLRGPAGSGPLAELAPLLDRDQFVASALRQHGRIVNRGERLRAGVHVVAVRDTTRGGTLFVAADGTPYPVALAGAANQASIEFRDWNADVTIAAPKHAAAIVTK
jgi:hypothetical protein